MKFVDFGFPEDKILGTFCTKQIVLPGRSRLRAKCKVSWALRLADVIYPYQLTADVGFLKEGGSGKSKKSLADID